MRVITVWPQYRLLPLLTTWIAAQLCTQRLPQARTRLIERQVDQDANGRRRGTQMCHDPIDRNPVEIGVYTEVRHPEFCVALTGLRGIFGQIRVRRTAGFRIDISALRAAIEQPLKQRRGAVWVPFERGFPTRCLFVGVRLCPDRLCLAGALLLYGGLTASSRA